MATSNKVTDIEMANATVLTLSQVHINHAENYGRPASRETSFNANGLPTPRILDLALIISGQKWKHDSSVTLYTLTADEQAQAVADRTATAQKMKTLLSDTKSHIKAVVSNENDVEIDATISASQYAATWLSVNLKDGKVIKPKYGVISGFTRLEALLLAVCLGENYPAVCQAIKPNFLGVIKNGTQDERRTLSILENTTQGFGVSRLGRVQAVLVAVDLLRMKGGTFTRLASPLKLISKETSQQALGFSRVNNQFPNLRVLESIRADIGKPTSEQKYPRANSWHYNALNSLCERKDGEGNVLPAASEEEALQYLLTLELPNAKAKAITLTDLEQMATTSPFLKALHKAIKEGERDFFIKLLDDRAASLLTDILCLLPSIEVTQAAPAPIIDTLDGDAIDSEEEEELTL